MRHVSLPFSDPFLAAAAVGYNIQNELMYRERRTDSNFWYSTGADVLFSKSRGRRKRMPQRAEYANLEGKKPVAQIIRQTRMEFLDNIFKALDAKVEESHQRLRVHQRE
jgi:hypothetical protein